MVKNLSESFPREARIVRSSDYRMLYKTGKKIYSERFILFWRENQFGHHRLGITVSRKVGNSVVRNRAKRLIREVFRKTYRLIPGQCDLVINVRSSCARAGYEELRTEFIALLKKLAHPGIGRE